MIRAIAFAVLAVPFWMLAQGGGGVISAGTSTVRGRVIPAPGRTAVDLRAIRVVIIPAGYPPQPLEAVVTSDGSFQFVQVPSGPYIARVLTDRMNIQSLDTQFAAHGIFVGNGDLSGIELEGPVAIMGRVIVEGGGKLPVSAAAAISIVNGAANFSSIGINARHVAIPGPTANGLRGNATVSGAVRADGVLELFLLPGEYQTALVAPDGYSVKSMTYGSVDLLKNTLKVDLPSSIEILATLSRPTGFSVRGRVTGIPAGGVPSGVSANLIGVGTVSVQQDGTFEFTGVPAGSRPLFLNRQGVSATSGNVATSRIATMDITVVDKDLDNVVLPWLPLSSVTLQASLIDGTGNTQASLPANIGVSVTSRNGTAIAACDYSACRRDVMLLGFRPDGSLPYSALLPAGDYDVRLDRLPPGYTAKSIISSDGTELLTQVFTVAQNSASLSIRAVIQSALQGVGVRLKGQVVTSTSSQLLPQKVQLRGTPPNALFSRQTSVSSAGTFEFTGILPGTYTLLSNGDGSPSNSGSSTVNIVIADRDLDGVPVLGLTDVQVPNSIQYANEAAVLLNLTTIQRAETRYNSVFGRFAGVSQLIDAGMLDSRFHLPGYSLNVTQSSADVIMVAKPNSASTGRYVFYASPRGPIAYAKTEAAPADDAAVTVDARGQLSNSGRTLARVTGCGVDAPMCLRFDQLLLTAAFDTPGRITMAASPGTSPTVIPTNIYVGLAAINGGGYLSPVLADGSFRIPAPLGDYQISIQNLPNGYTVRSATSGTTNLLAGPIHMDGAAAPPIEITLERR